MSGIGTTELVVLYSTARFTKIMENWGGPFNKEDK